MRIEPPKGWTQQGTVQDWYHSPDAKACVDTTIYHKTVHLWLCHTQWKAYTLEEYDAIKVLLEAL
jgi:hypothetical protein